MAILKESENNSSSALSALSLIYFSKTLVLGKEKQLDKINENENVKEFI